MISFFTGTDLFNTNNISIRELNKFNYLKDPLNKDVMLINYTNIFIFIQQVFSYP